MIRFLLQRPIAVLMAFTACFIVGLVTYFTIPVSLLPDIAIPEIRLGSNWSYLKRLWYYVPENKSYLL